MDIDDAYANGPHIPESDSYPPRWQQAAASFRETHQGHLDIPYGSHPRERLDLFLPSTPPRGLVVFIHGGYWLSFDKSSWSHFAAGALERGWAVALPSYVLAPEARLGAITRQIVAAIDVAATHVKGPIRVTGHSAGGQLTARMGDPRLPLRCRSRIERLVPISPLSDLRVMTTLKMNDDWGLDAGEAQAESPLLAPAPAAKTHVWVGAAERPVFLDHARWLADAWSADLTIDPGRHHFDVIDGLIDPQSPLCAALLDDA